MFNGVWLEFLGEHQAYTFIGQTYDHCGGSLRYLPAFAGFKGEGNVDNCMERQHHWPRDHKHAISIAASAMNTRANANTPTSAITSAAGENGKSTAMIGMIAEASHMQPNKI